MAIPDMVSLKQLQQFHSIDRMAYSRLVLTLGLNTFVSMKIVSFWNFLEKIGFRNFVNNLQQLSDGTLFSLAKEAVLCLLCLYSSSQEIFSRVDLDLPEMKKLVSQETMMGFLCKNRGTAKRMIEDFVKEVCEVAFTDIIRGNLSSKQSSKSPNGKSNSPTCNGGDDNGEKSNTKDDKGKVESEDRKLFMTFSRGHPVSKQELGGFIVEKFGKCVEEIYMDRTQKSLFACVVLKSHSDMSKILGGKKLVPLFINGKEARVRRFVPKSMKTANQR